MVKGDKDDHLFLMVIVLNYEGFYLAEGTLKTASLYHVHTASPTNVFMVAFRQNENIPLFVTEKASRFAF